MKTFDRRLTPARPDLAAIELAGQVSADRFVAGRPMRIVVEFADLRGAPAHDSGVDTQALFGEDLMLYEDHEGWGWVQLSGDSYVGYISMNALGFAGGAPDHVVCVNRTFVYPDANMKLPVAMALPRGARVAVLHHRPPFAQIAPGAFVFAAHLRPIGKAADDFVAIAETLMDTPYLWGGKTSLGLDCSGLVQLALAQAGIAAPRDTDLQAAALGTPVAVEPHLSGLRRGDLIFWKGHVGIMRDAETLLHANAHHMLVASEPLRDAQARIAGNGGAITGIKRL